MHMVDNIPFSTSITFWFDTLILNVIIRIIPYLTFAAACRMTMQPRLDRAM
jgi:hypothetical protein